MIKSKYDHYTIGLGHITKTSNQEYKRSPDVKGGSHRVIKKLPE